MQTICCIEDEAPIREVLELLLKDQAEFLPAASAREAIEHLVREPALFIIDLHLPGMNGLELTKLIRTIFPTVPIVVLTALSREKWEEKAIEMGANAFIEKPINPQEFRTLISELLPNRSILN